MKKQVDKLQFNPKPIEHYEKLLVSLRDVEDKYEFGDVQPFSWDDLRVAIQECKKALFWTTERLGHEFFEGLDAQYIIHPQLEHRRIVHIGLYFIG